MVAWAVTVAVAAWIAWSYQGLRRSNEQLAGRMEALEIAVAESRPAVDSGRQAAAAAAISLGSAAARAKELDQFRARLEQAAAVAPAPAVTKPAPTPEQIGAAGAARALLGRSIAAGRWTEESRQELAGLLNAADRDSREELARALIGAINDGRMSVEGLVL